jgi:hypothetical protein
MKMTVDKFVALKKKHGKLSHYRISEDSDWIPWKKEFGYPEKCHSFMFEDGDIWSSDYSEDGNGGVPCAISLPTSGGPTGGKI